MSPVTVPSSPTAALSGFPLLWACSGPSTSSTSPSESHASRFSFGRMAYGWFRGDKSQMSFKNCITDPNLIMILIGLVCFFFSIHPPALMATILDDLGALNTGLVMLVLGAYLAQSDMRAVVTSKKAYLVSLVRLVIIPAIVVGILCAFPAGLMPRFASRCLSLSVHLSHRSRPSCPRSTAATISLESVW